MGILLHHAGRRARNPDVVVLVEITAVETRIDQHSRSQRDVVVPRQEEFLELASELERVWENPTADIRLKKRIVRTLIHEIVAAMHKQMTVHELAAMPHYHPTLAEIWTYPAEELSADIARAAAR